MVEGQQESRGGGGQSASESTGDLERLCTKGSLLVTSGEEANEVSSLGLGRLVTLDVGRRHLVVNDLLAREKREAG